MLIWSIQGLRRKMQNELVLLRRLEMRLYINNFVVGLDTDSEDLAEASWVGYNRVRLRDWLGPFVEGGNTVYVLHQPVTFRWTGFGVGPVAWGYFVVDPATGLYHYGERFSSVIRFGIEDRELVILPKMSLRNITG
jgi:hypothetical protein